MGPEVSSLPSSSSRCLPVQLMLDIDHGSSGVILLLTPLQRRPFFGPDGAVKCSLHPLVVLINSFPFGHLDSAILGHNLGAQMIADFAQIGDSRFPPDLLALFLREFP
jgi:hypothetical protein